MSIETSSIRKYGYPLMILIAVLGIIVPIAWDRYKARTSLELQFLTSTTIVKDSPILSKLQILYDGKPIKSISNMTFSLVNTGSKPIIKSDIVSPPTLTFPEGVNLLDYKIEQRTPPNLEIEEVFNKNNRTFSLNFPLFNPEDSVRFSILLEGSVPKFQANARISNLKQLIVVDKTGEIPKKSEGVPWTVYLVGFFSLFFGFGAVMFFKSARADRKLKRTYILEKNPLPRFETAREYLDFVKKLFSSKVSPQIDPLAFFIEKAAKVTEEPLPENSQNVIEAAIIDEIKKDVDDFRTAGFFLFLFIIGLLYVVLRVL